MRARDIDQAIREALALTVVARAARALLDGEPRPSAASVGAELGAPPQITAETAELLVAAGLLASALDDDEPTYLPARDVDKVRVADVLAVLRHRSHPPDGPPPVEVQIDAGVRDVLDGLARAERRDDHNLTVRELAERTAPPKDLVPAEGNAPIPRGEEPRPEKGRDT